MDIRIGHGFDVHAFREGDSVWLGNLKIPHDRGIEAHSDGDVVLHALCDALLGALALGDIGQHFPPSDPRWKGADSAVFLQHVLGLVRAKGYELGNADLTILAERPKIGPHRLAMRERIASIVGCDIERISVKATTTEKLGFTGREEGIAAEAVVLLVRSA
ncbi:MAG: 2-C-methyl-D-erythritol 2,4-cyclodiphosphate synthase [Ahniella sp.]|nr:2-C-methyl-D-erythritol 2,4-cyclodiphosphate synthase [Ahniella sp.]